jgi:pimeloyl-ACP methyl ester carboxylesterase
MNLFFFGASGRQLFGAYHAPAARKALRGAALLCPPWGPEYFVAHRTLRQLAVRLADNGYHVLRFDYYGTGDSAGEREAGDLASWTADAGVALEELKDMTGESRITVFGVRLGAVVARRLARSRSGEVQTIVLWDPVSDGRRYIKELQAAQDEIDRGSLAPRAMVLRGSLPTELLGTPLPPSMAASMVGVTLEEFREPLAARVIVFFSDHQRSNDTLSRTLEQAGAQVRTVMVPGQTPWREETLMEGRIPSAAVERMVEALR